MVLNATLNNISTLVVICTDWIGSCESNYHTIMTTTDALQTNKQIKSKTSTKTKQKYQWWLPETPVRTDFLSD
jgi:hypothetical protein